MTSEDIIKDIIRIEGGYVDHPNDPGGATKYGISLRFYKKEINELADKETIFALTKDQAYRIYKKHFYFKSGCYRISFDEKLSHIILDQCVNVGIKRALKRLKFALQQTLSQIKYLSRYDHLFKEEVFKVEEFSVINQDIADKIRLLFNAKAEKVLINNYILESIKYYYSLGKRENYRVFFLGWMNRILRFAENDV